MKGDRLMRRLRAARPVAEEPGNNAALFARIVSEPGDPRLVQAPQKHSFRLLGRHVRPWTRARPRVLAGSSLGLAGVGAALVLALGGSAAAPAFAVTRQNDGSVLVTVNVRETTQPWVAGADSKLAAMGIDEQIMVGYAPGPASISGPVACTPLGGANTPAGAPVKVLLGTDGTQVIPAGTTGAGTVHLSSCVYYKSVGFNGSGNSGNTGAG